MYILVYMQGPFLSLQCHVLEYYDIVSAPRPHTGGEFILVLPTALCPALVADLAS